MEQKKVYRIVYIGLAAALVVSLLGCAGRTAQQPAEQKPTATGPSLYERLGGVNNIAMLMDDVIDRTYADPLLNANPRIAEAHKRFPRQVYKYQATNLACMGTGGPCKYTGRSPKEAHQHLQITETEWQEMDKIFRDSMNSFKVPLKEQDEVMAILESSKADVVVPSGKSASR
jgi:hemoglobin